MMMPCDYSTLINLAPLSPFVEEEKKSYRSNLLARHRFSKLDLSRKYDLNDRCKLSPVFTGTSDAALRSSLEGVKDAVSEHTVPGFLLWSPGVGGDIITRPGQDMRSIRRYHHNTWTRHEIYQEISSQYLDKT
ncbi:hypothetical protein RRG08_015557 [Elysia crispata]|uniref:Uncharacterized protein n=1 Tax=Elysia crispata TaxID=231223 RepID=A0AAE1CZK3_9GAST|nr:hypothetical protein RRG08_015557 [Elysia crispata]